MHTGRFVVRAVVGSLFIGHGSQKLFGSFGGGGVEGTSGFMESIDMRPGRRNALAAGYAEAGGGALLLAGLGTPFACAALIGTMITAIRKVHLPNGWWSANGGYEYNVALIAVLAALAEEGPGELSVDALLGMERSGPAWGAIALGLGAVASTLAIEVGRRGGAPAGPTGPSDPEVSPYPGLAGDPVTSDDPAVPGGSL